MRPLIYQPNPLAFPGGTPGFDPSHPAAQGISGTMGASFVPVTTGYLNLLTKKYLTLSGALAEKMNGYIGPGFTSSGYLISNTLATNTSLGRTWAIICFFTSFSNANFFQDSSNQYNGIFVGIGGNITIRINNISQGTIPITNGVPYFIVGSGYSALGYNILLLNLLTGAIKTATGTTTASFTSGGGYITFGTQAGCVYGPCMYAPTFLSMPQLLAWAQRPWDFWYPL